MSETLGLKNVNMLSKEQYDGIAEPTNEELWAVSGLGVGFPSDRYVDLTLGASGTSYTAPANGWFHIAKVPGSADTQITMINTCVTGKTDQAGNFTIRTQASTSGMTIYLNLPVKKGDVAVIKYTTTGKTDAFKFIYAVGEE